jgi:hypothetical protein
VRPMRTVLAALLLLTAAATPAAEPSPKREAGAPEPWQEGMPLMSGDRWARLHIDVDAKGRPLKCRIAATNLSESMRFYACQAFLRDWHVEPLVKDGVAVPGRVERTLMLPGPARRRLEEKARKRWLAEHPEAR